MMATIPAPAQEILTLIRVTETARADETAYETIYGHNEDKLTKPITAMDVNEVQHWQPGFTKSFGSSATGAYQFMHATLKELKAKVGLTGEEIFTPDLQDDLGFVLLKRRGYQSWIDGKSTTDTFMVGLAKEWASFPVPSRMQGAHRVVERGQSYYAGDGLNKALLARQGLAGCEAARGATDVVEPAREPAPKPEEPIEEPIEAVTLSKAEWQYALKTLGELLADPAKREALIAALQPEQQQETAGVA